MKGGRAMFPNPTRPPFPQQYMKPRVPMRTPFQMPVRPTPINPMIGGGMRQGGLKGLLSRIFPSSRMPMGSMNAANTAAGGLQGLTNPSNLSSMLGNVQKALGVAQQITPMVQQYGPLVKNLPAMFKLYKELKNSDDSGKEKNNNEPENELEEQNETIVEEEQDSLTQNIVQKKKNTSNSKRVSTPKMYI